MFACSSVKVNPFDYYNHVETQFISIKNLNSFQNYTIISSNDLIIMSNIITECATILKKIISIIFGMVQN